MVIKALKTAFEYAASPCPGSRSTVGTGFPVCSGFGSFVGCYSWRFSCWSSLGWLELRAVVRPATPVAPGRIIATRDGDGGPPG